MPLRLGRSQLPDYFKYRVTMLTRRRYRCAGWEIMNTGPECWKLCKDLNGEYVAKDGSYLTVLNAVWIIVNEYNELLTMVRHLESGE